MMAKKAFILYKKYFFLTILSILLKHLIHWWLFITSNIIVTISDANLTNNYVRLQIYWSIFISISMHVHMYVYYMAFNHISLQIFVMGPRNLLIYLRKIWYMSLTLILSSWPFIIHTLHSHFLFSYTLTSHSLLSKSKPLKFLTPASGPTPNHCVDGRSWGDELPHTINRASTLQDYPHLTDSWQKISLTTHVRVNGKSLSDGSIWWNLLEVSLRGQLRGIKVHNAADYLRFIKRIVKRRSVSISWSTHLIHWLFRVGLFQITFVEDLLLEIVCLWGIKSIVVGV